MSHRFERTFQEMGQAASGKAIIEKCFLEITNLENENS